MDAIKKFFAGLSSSSSSSASSSPSSSSSSSDYSSFEEHVFGMVGVISEDCGSQFVGTLVCVFVGLMGRIPIVKKSSRIAVDQGKRMLLSPFFDKKVAGTHRPSPCIASARGDASVGVQSGFLCPTLTRDRKLIGCEQITLIQEVSKSVVFKKLHASSKFFSGSSSSSSSSSDDDSSYHHLRQHDLCSTLASTTFYVLDGMIMKPIRNEDTNELEEMTTTAAGCHGAANNLESKDIVEKGSQISVLSKGYRYQDVCSTLSSTILCVLDGMIMKPIRNGDTNELEEMTTTASGCHGAANNFESTDVVEKGSQISILSKGHVHQMISLFESKRSNIVFEKESEKSFFSKGQNYMVCMNPLFQNEQSSLVFESNSKSGPIGSENSTNIGLRCKQDKKVVGIHRASPYIAPARGDTSFIVQSGFLQPTLTQDGKLVGCENRQGKDKRLTSVKERTRKSHKVDLTRKQEINAVNIHRIVPKGGKPIESQKSKGQKKQLNSVMERRTITGLVRKQHKQVVGTQRTITGVVPAQGHIPVVRSGFERPTLIQKYSRSIGSEKLQGSEKLLSSVAQSKKKPGIINSSRKNHINVVSTRKGRVDERSFQSVSKTKPGNIDPSRKNLMKVVSTRKDLVDERFLQSVSRKKEGNIDPSRKSDIKVVSTLKGFVDGRSLQSESKQKNVKTVPQVPSYKGGKISSTSELKPQWKF